MKTRAELLKALLGLDASDPRTFRTSVPFAVATPSAGLAADTAGALALINGSPYVKRTLADADVYVHTIEAASSRYISDRSAFLGANTLQNIAREAKAGFAVITGHKSGGLFSGGENPYGRTFAGVVEEKDARTRSVVQFYMLRDHKPNGPNAASTDDLDKGLVGGTLFDVSVGLKEGGTGRLVCDVCHLELFNECMHIPGTTNVMGNDPANGMTKGEIDKQIARGVPGGVATFTFDNYHPKEMSFVVDGALEGAGTALSTQPKITAHPREEEITMKWSTEQKKMLGLSETATDADVEAKLAELQTSANRTATLEKERKAERDAAFDAKVKDKLTVEEIAMLRDLPTRDQLADALIAKSGAAAPPPVGDPLRGTAAAAAPSKKPIKNPEFHQVSEELRESIGSFDSNEKLETAAMTSPLKALQKCLGVKSLRVPPEMIKLDQRILANRKAAFEIESA